MNGLQIVRGLIERGYSPHQAAALAGHILQESGGDPTNVNKDEDAHGLVQWRLDRWSNLQKFAADQGKSPTDPNVQLDFIGKEMRGPEARAGAGFLAAPDLASASAALKPYIRFGDDSAGTRLANAKGLMGQLSGPVGALDQAAISAPLTPVPTDISPAAAPAAAPAPPTLAGQVGNLASILSGPQQGAAQAAPTAPDYAPLQQIQMAQPNIGQSQQIAAALAKAYGIGV